MGRRRNSADKFWTRVQKTESCWLWTGRMDRKGYGLFSLGDRPRRAHRLAYQFAVGPIPPGLYVLHRCDNPPCCNPAHLFLGTHADNMADMVGKGRSLSGERHILRRHPELAARGERHSSRTHPERVVRGERVRVSRLTENQVREMRRLGAAGVTFAAIGAAFGVSDTTAGQVVKRRTWRHVD